MDTEVTLPEMGDEVEDVTISRWLVKEGQRVTAGDPLLEIATDKVDTEVPAPATGTLLSIRFGEGEIIELNAVIAIIGEATDEAGPTRADTGSADDESAPIEIEDAAGVHSESLLGDQQDVNSREVRATPVAKRIAAEAGIDLTVVPSRDGEQLTKGDLEAFLEEMASASGQDQEGATEEGSESQGDHVTPEDSVVPLEIRRLAATYDIDLRKVARGRPLGSLTRQMLIEFGREHMGLAHLEMTAIDRAPARSSSPKVGKGTVSKSALEERASIERKERGETLVPHSRMRQIIARNMVQSAFTSPHVTTVHSVDMGTVTAHYQAQKADLAQQGVRLTLTAYIVAAVVEGLKTVPAANAEWTDEGLILKYAYNIGMAVALPADATGVGGLIVPVIHDAGDMNLMGIARQVADLAIRARENRLTPADTQGGTFTLTNYGTSGSLFQTPVILQPQVAILGTGVIEKRPVVVSSSKPYEASVDDYLAFRPMMDLALSYDHRVLDGASADAFCAAVKRELEEWPGST